MEHLGQYVFEMTQAKVEALKKGGPVGTSGRVLALEERNQEMGWVEYGEDETEPAEEEEDEGADAETRVEGSVDGDMVVDEGPE